MNNGDQFYDPSRVSSPAFDDSGAEKQLIFKGKNTTTYKDVYSTIEIDRYRQGVELTREVFRRRGVFKIHSGEPGHAVCPLTFGGTPNTPSPNTFIDNMIDSPVSIITQGVPTEPSANHSYKFDSTRQNHYCNVYNGVIEPLAIRSIVSFMGPEVTSIAHSFKGAVLNGNESATYGSDVIVRMFVYGDAEPIEAFYDDILEYLTVKPGTSYITENVTEISPFTDRGIAQDFIDYDGDDMYDHIAGRLSGDPGYVPPNSYVARTGFIYEFDGNVVDSITFGGQTF